MEADFQNAKASTRFGHDGKCHERLLNRVELDHWKADCREYPLNSPKESVAWKIGVFHLGDSKGLGPVIRAALSQVKA